MGRWIALFFCLGGTWLLTNTDIRYFSLGWAISGLATIMWCYFGIRDKDLPRALMELFFVILCIRGVINFY